MSATQQNDGFRSRYRGRGDRGCRHLRFFLGAGIAALALGLSLAAPALAQEAPIPGAPSGPVPAFIDIPRLGTHAPIVPLGLDDDGALSAPTDPDTVGWWQDGPGVGGFGNMLLDGHVDWGGRLRAFGLLKLLDAGDEISVTDSDGMTRSYSVVWARLYDADTAPLDEIYPTSPDEQLTLITCGGAFDHAAHMYLSRWVIRAAPILSAD
jgi:sortase (surface protein transpeptidase)